MTSSHGSTMFAVRAGGFSASLFFAIGIYLPFFPVWLAGRGLSEPQIALVISAPLFLRALFSPLLAGIADRFGELRRSAMLYGVMTTLLFGWLAFAESYMAILVLSAAAMVFWVAMMPIGDAIILYGVRRYGNDYGRVRLWGSAAFILGTLVAGEAIGVTTANSVFFTLTAAFALGIVAALMLPSVADRTTAAQRSGFTDIIRDSILGRSIFAAAAITASHAAYYTFGSIYWREIGFADRAIAGLWAYSVVVEILLFFYARNLVRWGARRFLIAAGIGALIRWMLFPFTTNLVAAFCLQTLHGLTFGCAWLGVMMAIGAVAKPGHTARLQAGNQLVGGLLLALAILLSGPLYRAETEFAFWLMAVLGAIGLGVACTLPRGLHPQSDGEGGSTIASV